MFHYLVESAKDRFQQFADISVKGPLANPSGQGSPILQYGDWFEKYPHGVSRMHWEDPDMRKENGDDAVMSQQSDLQSVEDYFASLSPAQTSVLPRRQQKKAEKKDSSSNSRAVPRRTASFKQTAPPPPPMIDVPMANASMTVISTPTSEFSPLSSSNVYSHHDRAQVFNMPPVGYGFTTEHIPQLDQQLVSGTYNVAGPTTLPTSSVFIAANDTNGPILDNPSQWSDPFMSTGSSESFHSSSWFLPFNIDPAGVDIGIDPTPQPEQMPTPSGIVGSTNPATRTYSNSGNVIGPFNPGLAGMLAPN